MSKFIKKGLTDNMLKQFEKGNEKKQNKKTATLAKPIEEKKESKPMSDEQKQKMLEGRKIKAEQRKKEKEKEKLEKQLKKQQDADEKKRKEQQLKYEEKIQKQRKAQLEKKKELLKKEQAKVQCLKNAKIQKIQNAQLRGLNKSQNLEEFNDLKSFFNTISVDEMLDDEKYKSRILNKMEEMKEKEKS